MLCRRFLFVCLFNWESCLGQLFVGSFIIHSLEHARWQSLGQRSEVYIVCTCFYCCELYGLCKTTGEFCGAVFDYFFCVLTQFHGAIRSKESKQNNLVHQSNLSVRDFQGLLQWNSSLHLGHLLRWSAARSCLRSPHVCSSFIYTRRQDRTLTVI